MAAKNFFGIMILILNAAGLGYLIFIGFQSLVSYFLPKEDKQDLDIDTPPPKAPLIIDEDLIPNEDELLKDLDLSDLDNLNLDDFE
jgi:hypothetical protein